MPVPVAPACVTLNESNVAAAGGVNVNTPVELSYAKLPAPLAPAVIALMSVSAIPLPAPPLAVPQLSVPAPFVRKNCPAAPSVGGNSQTVFTLSTLTGALNPT